MEYVSLYKNLLATLVVIALCNACSTKTEEEKEETVTDSVAINNPVQKELNSDQSQLLNTALSLPPKGEQGIVRGISFGDAIEKVKATETFEMFEENSDHLGYTFETPQLETIDVQYFLGADKKVNKISIDVYLNSAAATTELSNAGKKYFTDIYSTPKQNKSVVTWNKNAVRVNMEDVSKGKDYGLKFEFFPAGKPVLAAK